MLAALDAGQPPPRAELRTAVRYLLDLLAARAPGRAIEVRVPPYAAVQCGEGPRHTRGTPPNVVETDPVTWIRLATGRLTWAEAAGSAHRGQWRAGGPAAFLPAAAVACRWTARLTCRGVTRRWQMCARG